MVSKWTWPVTPPPYVTSAFALKRKHPITGALIPHTGADFRAPLGARVLAAGAGTVVRSAYDPPRSAGGTGAGYHVRVDHGDGITTRYYHLAATGRVSVGDRVRAGEQVGASGNTGDSTAAHLHFEVRVDGTPVDPVPWLAARLGVALTGAGTGATGALPTVPTLDPLDPLEEIMPTLDEIAGAVWSAAWGRTTRETAAERLLAARVAAERADAKADAILAAVSAIPGVDADALAAAVAARVEAIDAQDVADRLTVTVRP